ncbi:MAG: DUF4339 domain-containing protein [Planctomycetota bacterium]
MAKKNVTCDFCGRTFRVPSGMVGEKVTCECGSVLEVSEKKTSAASPRSQEFHRTEQKEAPEKGWYVHQHGESVGPKTLGELQQLIHSGKLQGTDKVYHESLKSWQTVSSLPYLNSRFQPPPIADSRGEEAEDRKWYVRVDGRQHGPYSSEQIRKMVAKNQLQTDSQIWNAEQGNWKPLRSVEPFASIIRDGGLGKTKNQKDRSSHDRKREASSSGQDMSKEEETTHEEEEEAPENKKNAQANTTGQHPTPTGLTTNLKGLFQRGGKDKSPGAQVPSTVLTVEYVDDTEGIETYLKDIVGALEGLQKQTNQMQQYVSRLARALNQQKRQNQESTKALRRRLDRLYSQLENQPGPSDVQEDPAKEEKEAGNDEEFGVPAEYSNDQAHQRAWQVAQVMASDLEAYHPDEVEEGVMYANIREVLSDEIAEARETYEDRTPERVRQEVDYFDMALRELVARNKS